MNAKKEISLPQKDISIAFHDVSGEDLCFESKREWFKIKLLFLKWHIPNQQHFRSNWFRTGFKFNTKPHLTYSTINLLSYRLKAAQR